MNTPDSTEAKRPGCFGLVSGVYDPYSGNPGCLRTCPHMSQCHKVDEKRLARVEVKQAEAALTAGEKWVLQARAKLDRLEGA